MNLSTPTVPASAYIFINIDTVSFNSQDCQHKALCNEQRNDRYIPGPTSSNPHVFFTLQNTGPDILSGRLQYKNPYILMIIPLVLLDRAGGFLSLTVPFQARSPRYPNSQRPVAYNQMTTLKEPSQPAKKTSDITGSPSGIYAMGRVGRGQYILIQVCLNPLLRCLYQAMKFEFGQSTALRDAAGYVECDCVWLRYCNVALHGSVARAVYKFFEFTKLVEN